MGLQVGGTEKLGGEDNPYVVVDAAVVRSGAFTLAGEADRRKVVVITFCHYDRDGQPGESTVMLSKGLTADLRDELTAQLNTLDTHAD